MDAVDAVMLWLQLTSFYCVDILSTSCLASEAISVVEDLSCLHVDVVVDMFTANEHTLRRGFCVRASLGLRRPAVDRVEPGAAAPSHQLNNMVRPVHIIQLIGSLNKYMYVVCNTSSMHVRH